MKYDIFARGIWLFLNRSFRHQFTIFLGKETTTEVKRKAKQLYHEIILRSSSIGGRKNPLTMNVLIAAFIAAFYKSAIGQITVEQMGLILSNAMEETAAFRSFTKIMSRKIFTRKWQDGRNKVAIESQRKFYPANFVSEFIYGKTTDEYGINYLECAICKLFQQENCLELVQQMCQFDYVMAKYMGCKLSRTKTIANGDGICDFWYTKSLTQIVMDK
jgi:hypothetical protein